MPLQMPTKHRYLEAVSAAKGQRGRDDPEDDERWARMERATKGRIRRADTTVEQMATA